MLSWNPVVISPPQLPKASNHPSADRSLSLPRSLSLVPSACILSVLYIPMMSRYAALVLLLCAAAQDVAAVPDGKIPRALFSFGIIIAVNHSSSMIFSVSP